MKIKGIKKLVKVILSPYRYRHSLAVAKVSKKLARHHGVPWKPLYKAALLHDVGYFIGNAPNKSLSHAHISTRFASGLGIDDPSLLHAIECHTLGCPGMDDSAKILYLADKIEPHRDYPGVQELRDMAYHNLDDAMLLAIQQSRHYLNRQGKKLHAQTRMLEHEIILQKRRSI